MCTSRRVRTRCRLRNNTAHWLTVMARVGVLSSITLGSQFRSFLPIDKCLRLDFHFLRFFRQVGREADRHGAGTGTGTDTAASSTTTAATNEQTIDRMIDRRFRCCDAPASWALPCRRHCRTNERTPIVVRSIEANVSILAQMCVLYTVLERSSFLLNSNIVVVRLALIVSKLCNVQCSMYIVFSNSARSPRFFMYVCDSSALLSYSL